MLESLYIKNFILISEINIDFHNGFTSFTGETGAGKSILMDAIGLLCGDRASTSQIRNGYDKAIIEGTFSVDDNLRSQLAALGFDDDVIIVTREFDKEGKSSCRINHRNVTAGNLKETIAKYIDIHSQRENQYLLNTKYHLSLLDAFCNNNELISKVKESYQLYKNLRDELDKLQNITYAPGQEELYNFQLNEIESAELKIGEDVEIEEKVKVMSSYEKIFSKINNALESLDGDNGSLNFLFEAIRNIKSISESSEIQKISEKMENNYYELTDLKDELKEYQSGMEMDEDELNRLNERIYTINGLKRKYGITIEEILAKANAIKTQLETISNKEEVIQKKQKELDLSLAKYHEYADVLSKYRKEQAAILEKKVTEELADLQLKNAKFVISFNETAPSSQGIDDINFMISMNPGEPARPLQKVASGGELSRLMLGLKTIFNALWGTQLVIFDEIDTGVSGSVAFSIGKKMHDIAKSSQVFSVTHLAPVAACADYQYKVLKTTQNGQTFTSIVELSTVERIKELALINTGDCSLAAKQSASELLERASKI